MSLDVRLRLLDWLLKRRPPVHQMSLDAIQRMNEEALNSLVAWLLLGQKRPLAAVQDRTIPGRHGTIPIRLYYPSQSSNLPLVVFFHGGGWVTGNLETHDVVCRRVAYDTGALVVAIDYRRAPWYPYPVPGEDCYDATCWLADQATALKADSSKIVVMGDSAGGNLATVVAMMIRDQGGPHLQAQILIYPAVDGTLSYSANSPYADGPFLTKATMDFYVAQYAAGQDVIHDPYFSPLLAPDVSGLPPALMQTAEYDPLHDEAVAYAQHLQQAGVAVQHTDYPGMIHAFLSFPRFCQGANAAFDEIARFITATVGKPSWDSVG